MADEVNAENLHLGIGSEAPDLAAAASASGHVRAPGSAGFWVPATASAGRLHTYALASLPLELTPVSCPEGSHKLL